MYEQMVPNQPHPHRKPSPERGTREKAERRYEETLYVLSHAVVYNDEHVPADAIERQIRTAMRVPQLESIEAKRHGLESLLHLLRGAEAHESANRIQRGDWQRELVRGEDSPETLTREDVAGKFVRFASKDELTKAENAALEHYQRLLGLSEETHISLTANVSVERADINLLVNDLRTRIAERNPDETERRAALQALDRELAEIAKRIPDEQWGKRYEFEEIYLFRRLIHAADTGHLASVSHGTLREDLHPESNSVDMVVAAAGDVIPLQIKTLKRGVSWKTREIQVDVVAEMRRRLEKTSTHPVVLWMEDVEKTFERALRQPTDERTSLKDKYEALQPITDPLDERQRHRLLALTGLTEKDFMAEREKFEAKQAERRQIEEELRQKREKEAKRFAEGEERARLEVEHIGQERRDEEEKEQKRLAEIERARAEAHEKHRAEAEAARAKLMPESELTEKTAAAARRAAEKRAQEAETERERKKREAATAKLRATLEQKKAKGWPPKKLILAKKSPDLLIKLGLLSPDWNGAPQKLLRATKEYDAEFAMPKNGVEPGESQPNELFMKAFPTKESFESPTVADVDRWRKLGLGEPGQRAA